MTEDRSHQKSLDDLFNEVSKIHQRIRQLEVQLESTQRFMSQFQKSLSLELDTLTANYVMLREELTQLKLVQARKSPKG